MVMVRFGSRESKKQEISNKRTAPILPNLRVSAALYLNMVAVLELSDVVGKIGRVQ